MRHSWHLLASLGALAGATVTGSTAAYAQSVAPAATGRVTGTVADASRGLPLGGVVVGLVGQPGGARSNADGRFTIANLTPGRYRVRAQLIGFAPREDTVTVAAGQTTTLAFRLVQATVSLQQVVVVGYGTQRRSDLTGSVASVTPQVERTPITSVEQTLQGTAPGVQVTQASSAPGGGMSIRIRGGSSISGNNEPLYVIDGFPVENDPGNASPTSGGRDASATVPQNPLASINPADIASIEILKDASATSIYGARGANGVVIITTKRGSAGKPVVTLDAYTGTQSVAKRYDLLNAHEFALFANQWGQAQTTPVTPFANPDTIGGGTDWQGQIFRSAPIYNAQLGVTGGTTGDNATRYAISGGTFQQQGVVDGSAFNRLSLRGNIDQMVAAKLHLGSNVLVSRVNTTQIPTDGSFNSGAGAVLAALSYVPTMPVRRADGTYTLSNTSDYPTALSAAGLNGGTIPNPVASARDVQDQLGDTRVLGNVFGEYTFFENLTFRTSLGADLSNRTRDTYYPRTTLQGMALNGQAIRGTLNNTSFLNENTLNYQHSFGSQTLQALAGYTRQSLVTNRQNQSNSGFVSDITDFNNIGAGTQAGGPTVGSFQTRWTLVSYLGRLNYTALDRYLFTVTGREDGSSRFGADHRYGFFPSAAVGWRLSEEPLLRPVFHGFEQFKLRASYGVAGNPSISPYQSIPQLAPQQYVFNGTLAPGYYPSVLGNANLQWETTKQADVGIDFTTRGGRLDVTADYYSKQTSNLLLGVNLPTETGYSTALENAGAIKNAGVELSATLNLIRGDKARGAFNYSTTFTYARNRNRVVDLGGVYRIFASSVNSDIKASGTMVQVGQPIGVFYGYQTDGLFRDSASLAAWNAKTKLSVGTAQLGGSRFVDVNGDGVIDANDRTIIGNPNPKFTGGWQNSFSWKGFDLFGLFDFSYGGQLLNLNLYRVEGASPSQNVLRARYEDAWSPTNPNGKYQKIGASIGTYNSSDFTTDLIEDGSFFRLRTVTLSHAIPRQLLRTNGGAARLYVTGQNLFTATHYSGFNPDVSSLGVGNLNRGVDIGAYPLARSVIVGLNLSY